MLSCSALPASEVVEEITPFGIRLLDESEFPVPPLTLQLLLAADGARRRFRHFIPDEHVHAILLGESLDQAGLVFPDAAQEVVCHADVESPIATAGQHIDVELAHVSAVPHQRSVAPAKAGAPIRFR